MTRIAIIFGGNSPEHNESIRAARTLYKYALSKLTHKYDFKYFYLDRDNDWISADDSKRIIQDLDVDDMDIDRSRIQKLRKCDIAYNTMMGTCGENGNIMGLCDLYNIPIIGCDILPSALSLDKRLSKIVVESIGIPVVDGIAIHKDDPLTAILDKTQKKIGFPCIGKPVNMGTCSYVFKANDQADLTKKWKRTIRNNDQTTTYLIEKFIPNIEVRVFLYTDSNDNIHTNDRYVTTLKKHALDRGGALFDHVDNELPKQIREKIKEYAATIFRTFDMKDYARIDFFVDPETKAIYFNEINTQPHITSYNVKLLKQDNIGYDEWFDMMVRKNLK